MMIKHLINTTEHDKEARPSSRFTRAYLRVWCAEAEGTSKAQGTRLLWQKQKEEEPGFYLFLLLLFCADLEKKEQMDF